MCIVMKMTCYCNGLLTKLKLKHKVRSVSLHSGWCLLLGYGTCGGERNKILHGNTIKELIAKQKIRWLTYENWALHRKRSQHSVTKIKDKEPWKQPAKSTIKLNTNASLKESCEHSIED